MSRKTPEVRQHPHKGRGWAVIMIPGVSAPPETFEFAIQDNANAKWFNDDGNWATSQTELLPRAWGHQDGTLALTVGPDVVNRMLPQPIWLIMSQVGVKQKLLWPKLEPSAPGTAPPRKQKRQPERDDSIFANGGGNKGGGNVQGGGAPMPRSQLIAAAVALLLLGGLIGALLAWWLIGDDDSRIAELRNQVASLEQERDAARTDLDTAEERAARLQDELDAARTDLQDERERADSLQDQLDRLRDRAPPASGADDLRARIQALDQDLADARTRARQAETDRDEAQGALARAAEEAEGLRKQLADAKQRIEDLEAQLGTGPDPDALAQAQRDVRRLQGDLRNAQDSISSLQDQLADRPTQQQLADARARADRLNRALEGAQARIRELENQLQNPAPGAGAVEAVFSDHRDHLLQEIGVTRTILVRLQRRIESGEPIPRVVRSIYGSRDNGLTDFLCEKLPDRCG